MKKWLYLGCALLAGGLLFTGCGGSGGGGGGGDTVAVQLDWDANLETAVNSAGGGYRVYYSRNSGFDLGDATKVDVPFVSGAQAPTSTSLDLKAGTYYIRITAYSAINPSGSDPSDEITLVVP